MTRGKTLVVLLAYKSNPEWLKLAMHSVACQTRTDYRCVVADSTPEADPRSAEVFVVGNSANEDARFVYKRYPWQPHADVAKKVNAAIADFGDDCEYVVILADDDFLAPRFLEVQAGSLDEDPVAGFAQGGVHFFGDNTGFWLTDLPPNKEVADQVTRNQFAGTCVMRLPLFREFGGYDVDSVPDGFAVGLEDFTLFVHFLRAGWRYTTSPEILLFCRQGSYQNSRKLYGSDLYWPLIQKLCLKQGIDCKFTQNGIELVYQQVRRSPFP